MSKRLFLLSFLSIVLINLNAVEPGGTAVAPVKIHNVTIDPTKVINLDLERKGILLGKRLSDKISAADRLTTRYPIITVREPAYISNVKKDIKAIERLHEKEIKKLDKEKAKGSRAQLMTAVRKFRANVEKNPEVVKLKEFEDLKKMEADLTGDFNFGTELDQLKKLTKPLRLKTDHERILATFQRLVTLSTKENAKANQIEALFKLAVGRQYKIFSNLHKKVFPREAALKVPKRPTMTIAQARGWFERYIKTSNELFNKITINLTRSKNEKDKLALIVKSHMYNIMPVGAAPTEEELLKMAEAKTTPAAPAAKGVIYLDLERSEITNDRTLEGKLAKLKVLSAKIPTVAEKHTPFIKSADRLNKELRKIYDRLTAQPPDQLTLASGNLKLFNESLRPMVMAMAANPSIRADLDFKKVVSITMEVESGVLIPALAKRIRKLKKNVPEMVKQTTIMITELAKPKVEVAFLSRLRGRLGPRLASRFKKTYEKQTPKPIVDLLSFVRKSVDNLIIFKDPTVQSFIGTLEAARTIPLLTKYKQAIDKIRLQLIFTLTSKRKGRALSQRVTNIKEGLEYLSKPEILKEIEVKILTRVGPTFTKRIKALSKIELQGFKIFNANNVAFQDILLTLDHAHAITPWKNAYDDLDDILIDFMYRFTKKTYFTRGLKKFRRTPIERIKNATSVLIYLDDLIKIKKKVPYASTATERTSFMNKAGKKFSGFIKSASKLIETITLGEPKTFPADAPGYTEFFALVVLTKGMAIFETKTRKGRGYLKKIDTAFLMSMYRNTDIYHKPLRKRKIEFRIKNMLCMLTYLPKVEAGIDVNAKKAFDTKLAKQVVKIMKKVPRIRVLRGGMVDPGDTTRYLNQVKEILDAAIKVQFLARAPKEIKRIGKGYILATMSRMTTPGLLVRRISIGHRVRNTVIWLGHLKMLQQQNKLQLIDFQRAAAKATARIASITKKATKKYVKAIIINRMTQEMMQVRAMLELTVQIGPEWKSRIQKKKMFTALRKELNKLIKRANKMYKKDPRSAQTFVNSVLANASHGRDTFIPPVLPHHTTLGKLKELDRRLERR